MILSWLCKCSHRLDEHDLTKLRYCGSEKTLPGCCCIVTVRMFGFQHHQGDSVIEQCKCYKYDPISNLEYLEKQYETSQNT